jgi:tetratricopeptide (TPR) repeat protein
MPNAHSALPDFDALWNYEQPEHTEQAFVAILQQAGVAAPPTYRLQLLTQIARAQGLQRRFAAAHETLDRVQRELAGGPLLAGESADVTPRVRYLLERGRVMNSAGQPERARPLFLDAWKAATAAQQDGYAVDAAHMLGIVEPADNGLAWNRTALALALASDDPRARRWQGSLYNNLGWAHYGAAEFEQALALFESAVAAWELDGQTERVPSARWAVARTMRALGRIQAALTQQALLADFERVGRPNGYVQEEPGECLLALGHSAEARPHFARAWAQLSQDVWLAEAEPARLERLHALSALDTLDAADGNSDE